MSFAKQTLAALGKIGIVLAIGIAFLSGLAGTVYLSLRSAEVRVPEIVGKDRMAAESALTDAGLRMRQRAIRFSAEAQPNTILDQSPKPGEVIKVGQTVAVVLSRAAAKEGETSTPLSAGDNKPETEKQQENKNTNTSTAAANNKNENQNQNKERRNRNTNNKNANNTNNGNANNKNANNTNNRNVNATRNTNAANSSNANTNSSPGANNSNTNKRPPVNISTPPFNPTGTTP